MFAPTACTTPTRLPTLMWTLSATLLLLSVFAPAFAAQTHSQADGSPTSAAEAGRLEIGAWRVLSLEQMTRVALRRRLDAAPSRMLPLAVLPTQRSALWLGLSGGRAAGARIELRWAVALDGSAPTLRGLYDE